MRFRCVCGNDEIVFLVVGLESTQHIRLFRIVRQPFATRRTRFTIVLARWMRWKEERKKKRWIEMGYRVSKLKAFCISHDAKRGDLSSSVPTKDLMTDLPTAGIEPATFCLLGKRSTNELSGLATGRRTDPRLRPPNPGPLNPTHLCVCVNSCLEPPGWAFLAHSFVHGGTASERQSRISSPS